MWTCLLVLLGLTGPVEPMRPPDASCLIVDVDYLYCTWNGQSTPQVNYTFTSRFSRENQSDCASYELEGDTIVGCMQPHPDLWNARFNVLHTTLKHGNHSREQTFELKTKVRLHAPTNLTARTNPDYNLWLYWNQTVGGSCSESEVRYRTDQSDWKLSRSAYSQQYCINLPSSRLRYEMQVRCRVSNDCGQSEQWSTWSQPVFWSNSSAPHKANSPAPTTSVWTPVMYVIGALSLILLVLMLLYHERIRVELVPVDPNLAKNLDGILIHGNLELPISKDLKEGFKANFSEFACSVREYSAIPQTESSASSVTTDQSDCSITTSVNQSEGLGTSCSSSTSTLPVWSEEEEEEAA